MKIRIRYCKSRLNVQWNRRFIW